MLSQHDSTATHSVSMCQDYEKVNQTRKLSVGRIFTLFSELNFLSYREQDALQGKQCYLVSFPDISEDFLCLS